MYNPRLSPPNLPRLPSSPWGQQRHRMVQRQPSRPFVTFLLLLLAIIHASLAVQQHADGITGQKLSATVWLDPSTNDIHIDPGILNDPKALAWGVFDETHISSSGWGKLSIEASPAAELRGHHFEAMYAMGVLEGYLTCTEIYHYYVSMVLMPCTTLVPMRCESIHEANDGNACIFGW